jgi:hypothetical protein
MGGGPLGRNPHLAGCCRSATGFAWAPPETPFPGRLKPHNGWGLGGMDAEVILPVAAGLVLILLIVVGSVVVVLRPSDTKPHP